MTVLSRREVKCIRNSAWWCVLVIPGVQETEAGGSKFGSHPKGTHCQLVCKKQTGKLKRRACVF